MFCLNTRKKNLKSISSDEVMGKTEEPEPTSASSTPEITPATMNMDTLGTSEQEQDDSFAWLESLAAKQGASEGLLTKPEERKEEEPEWIKQAKSSRWPVSTTSRRDPAFSC